MERPTPRREPCRLRASAKPGPTGLLREMKSVRERRAEWRPNSPSSRTRGAGGVCALGSRRACLEESEAEGTGAVSELRRLALEPRRELTAAPAASAAAMMCDRGGRLQRAGERSPRAPPRSAEEPVCSSNARGRRTAAVLRSPKRGSRREGCELEERTRCWRSLSRAGRLGGCQWWRPSTPRRARLSLARQQSPLAGGGRSCPRDCLPRPDSGVRALDRAELAAAALGGGGRSTWMAGDGAPRSLVLRSRCRLEALPRLAPSRLPAKERLLASPKRCSPAKGVPSGCRGRCASEVSRRWLFVPRCRDPEYVSAKSPLAGDGALGPRRRPPLPELGARAPCRKSGHQRLWAADAVLGVSGDGAPRRPAADACRGRGFERLSEPWLPASWRGRGQRPEHEVRALDWYWRMRRGWRRRGRPMAGPGAPPRLNEERWLAPARDRWPALERLNASWMTA